MCSYLSFFFIFIDLSWDSSLATIILDASMETKCLSILAWVYLADVDVVSSCFSKFRYLY